MFLNELSNEEKNLFIDLCIYGAESNQIFADEEKAMINAYCTEMQINVSDNYKAEKELEELL